jgi:hypothetical protein
MTSTFCSKGGSVRARARSNRWLRTLGSMLLFTALTPSLTATASRTFECRTVSTSNPRPMGIGGAFISITDDLPALIWNPAAFTLYEREVSHRLSVHLNPVAPVLILREEHHNVEDFLGALGTVVRAVTFSHRWAEMGLLFWEEPLYNPAASVNGRFFDAEHILKQHIHTFGLRVRLASTVSLGSTGNLYRIRDKEGKSVLAGGANYGVLLKPTRGLVVGLTYFDFPGPMAELRWETEGLRDESINGGISVHPDNRTIVAMDLRDAGGEEKIGWNKFRFGFERTFWEHLALRFGYFQTGTQRYDVYSFGLGLFGRGRRGQGAPPYDHNSYLANYALLVEEGKRDQHFLHLLSVQFCI